MLMVSVKKTWLSIIVKAEAGLRGGIENKKPANLK